MISGVSTGAINMLLRRSIQTAQRELSISQTEVQTGAMADVAATLGVGTVAPISFLRDVTHIESILDTNKSVATRLSATQASLGSVLESTQSLFGVLTAARGNSQTLSVAAKSANSLLGSMVSALNTAVSGQHIFAGLNTDNAPLNVGNSIPAGAEMDSAFLGFFGFSKTDVAASSITPASFQAFVTAQVAPLFLGAPWSGGISNATDAPIRSRIALSESHETSVTANEPAVRDALFGAALAANFLGSSLNAQTQDGVIEKASQLSSSAVASLAQLQGRVGLIQQKLTLADNRLSAQRDLFASAAEDLTSVDPYEAATKLNSLLTKIETSYALTQKIQQLSILRYLA